MKTKLTWFDRIMAAVTFAEANEHTKGKDFLTPGNKTTGENKCKECDDMLTCDLNGVEAHS